MKVCFVCSEFPPGPHGGIGTFTQMMSRALSEAGHEVRVVGIYSADFPGAEYEEAKGVRVWRLRAATRHSAWVMARYQLYRKVAAWCDRGAVDLVEVPDFQGWAAGWPSLGVPVIARLHSAGSYLAAELGRSVGPLMFLLESASLRRADFCCSVSHYTARRTSEVFHLRSRPCAILPNFVDLPTGRREVTRAPNRVVFAGSLSELKGVRSLIRAWPLVVGEKLGAELHVFGKDNVASQAPSMRASLLSLLTTELQSTVHFHGHVPRERVLEEFQTAQVAVFPSYAESFPFAPLEAMAAGCPTIYTVRGGGRELIEPERTGLLVDPDRPAEIAAGITRLLKDPALAQRLGNEARSSVEKCFSTSVMIGANENFYRDCVTAFHSTRAAACGAEWR